MEIDHVIPVAVPVLVRSATVNVAASIGLENVAVKRMGSVFVELAWPAL